MCSSDQNISHETDKNHSLVDKETSDKDLEHVSAEGDSPSRKIFVSTSRKEHPTMDDSPQTSTKRKRKKPKNRLRDEPHVVFGRGEHESRPLLPSPCQNKNKHRCSRLVSEEQRRNIYDAFRILPTINDQRCFIAKHVNRIPKKRETRPNHSRRLNTCVYSLTVNQKNVQVCREFFMATLNITDALLRSSLDRKTDTGVLTHDMRGRHTPYNKISQETENGIRRFILSFPTMEFRCCSETTVKKYLDASLNITIMYNRFIGECKEKGERTVSFEKFRSIFRGYGVDFFKPRKDMCETCLIFRDLSQNENIVQEDFKTHVELKEADA